MTYHANHDHAEGYADMSNPGQLANPDDYKRPDFGPGKVVVGSGIDAKPAMVSVRLSAEEALYWAQWAESELERLHAARATAGRSMIMESKEDRAGSDAAYLRRIRRVSRLCQAMEQAE